MKKRTAFTVLGAFAFSLLLAAPALAGGALETFDITAGTPSPIPGHILARVIGIKWDSRCIPVGYLMNNTEDPIPNPLAPFTPVMTLAQATAATQASFDAWNDIPTSFIDMNVVGTVANAGFRGFDMKNEITFRTAAGFGAIASSPSVAFIIDVTLVDGDDIDGDGDSDVSNAISVCTDVDNDGDNEFPAGFYKAGTILDNDVQFNTKVSNGFRFTTLDSEADIITRSVDYIGVAVHEFGHSFGLSHVLDNQFSDSDGTGSTMYPFIDTGDPASELSERTPALDDIAFAAYFYPEGSANSGPGALQAGDVDFDDVWGLIRGEATHGPQNKPLAGGSLTAISHGGDQRLVSAFSGTTNVSFNPATGGLFFVPLANQDQGVVNGNYVIPVPSGVYTVGLEAVDGNPVAAGSISFTTQIGSFYGQHNFQEEFFDRQESDIEKRIGDSDNVQVSRGSAHDGVDIITNETSNILNFGALNVVGFTDFPPGGYYAVQVPASQVIGAGPLIHAALFHTFVVDASTVPIFAEATLTTGTVSGAHATIALKRPLARVTGFIGQDNDLTPLYFDNPHQLGNDVRKGIEKGDIQNLFLVLRLPTSTPFPGISHVPPLIGLNTTGTIHGFSFLSSDGGTTFTRNDAFNFRFGLVTGGDPNP